MESSSSSPESPRFLPLLLLLFVGSGCAALIYEIVWFQMLELVIGSTAVSLGVLLATFMGGMCAGSLSWPRLVAAGRHPLRVYALLEAGTGAIGVAVLLGLPLAGKVYTLVAGLGFPGVTLRAVLAAICLLPPTFLMGATLPVIARWIRMTPRGVSWLGFFYGGNTAGAVLGALVAGFYLLRVHDMAFTTLCAAAINFAVSAFALLLAQAAPYRADHAVTAAALERPGAAQAGTVLGTLALSGFCALGAEVVWTRMLALMFGGTVYTFSLILAVFLAGIGIGGAGGAVMARDFKRPGLALGVCQLLQAVAVAWAAYNMASSLPFWPLDHRLGGGVTVHFEIDLLRCAFAVLPSALIWGASFPLGLAALASPDQDPGRLVGTAYAANTLGAIGGSLAAALVLLPGIGTQRTDQVLVGLTVASGLLVLFPPRGEQGRRRLTPWATGLGISAAAAALLISTVPKLPWSLVAYGRELMLNPISRITPLYLGEGRNSTVGVTSSVGPDGPFRSFHVAGKVEASTLPKDMALQRKLGHIPAMFHSDPKSVLIVGFGAGVTAGSFTQYPGIERIVICEIEPLIPQDIAPYFSAENYDVVHDPRVQIVYDDARHYLLTTKEKFDIITSDPIHPWVKGSATLYTEEYFDLVRQHLNPNGLVTQWVPFYESDEAVVKSELATFFQAFPGGTVWGNEENGAGYDVVLLGQLNPAPLDIDAIMARWAQPENAPARASLASVGIDNALALLSNYAGRDQDLKQLLAGAEINRDRNLRLQYLAGLELYSDTGRAMYGSMLNYAKFPNDSFTGSPQNLAALSSALERASSSRQEQIAGTGDPVAEFNLGLDYLNGDGVEKSEAEAAKWFLRAATAGLVNAQFNLAVMYRTGTGVKQDLGEALKWYQKAAGQGEAKAQFDLGLMYLNGTGVEKDQGEAAKWFLQAANQGLVGAQNNLAVMYQTGAGVERSDTEAAKWFQKAAEQGHAGAQTNLGIMYVNGTGVAKNDTEAAKWFREAADQGVATAQFNLGLMYQNGMSLPRDMSQAASWYRKAAEQGLAPAEYNLAILYRDGNGVPKDEAAAEQWFGRASDQGYRPPTP